MEFFGVLLGGIFFTLLITAWLGLCWRWKIRKTILIAGIVCLLIPPALGAVSLGWYMFIDEPRNMALIDAAGEGNVQKVQELLKDGVSPNADFEGDTPLKEAMRNKHYDVVRILKEAGAVEEQP